MEGNNGEGNGIQPEKRKKEKESRSDGEGVDRRADRQWEEGREAARRRRTGALWLPHGGGLEGCLLMVDAYFVGGGGEAAANPPTSQSLDLALLPFYAFCFSL